MSERLATRLIQLGTVFLTLGVVSGFMLVTGMTRIPRLTLSVHVTLMIGGPALIAYGLIWDRLRLGAGAEKLAFWALVYGLAANWLAGTLAASLGAGGTTLTFAAAGFQGSSALELFLKGLLGSGVAATGLGTVVVMGGALRMGDA